MIPKDETPYGLRRQSVAATALSYARPHQHGFRKRRRAALVTLRKDYWMFPRSYPPAAAFAAANSSGVSRAVSSSNFSRAGSQPLATA